MQADDDSPRRKHVFLSHAQADRSLAEVVCRFLEECGHPCWMAPPVALMTRASEKVATFFTALRARQSEDGTVFVPGGVLFGRVLMGCNEAVDDMCLAGEEPSRQVEVATFHIDRTEIAVADISALRRRGGLLAAEHKWKLQLGCSWT